MKKVYHCCVYLYLQANVARKCWKQMLLLLCLFHIWTENLNSRSWQNDVTFSIWWILCPLKIDQWDMGFWVIADKEITSCRRTMDFKGWLQYVDWKKKEEEKKTRPGTTLVRDLKPIPGKSSFRLFASWLFFTCEKGGKRVWGDGIMK